MAGIAGSNTNIAIPRKPHTALHLLAVQMRTVFVDATCLKLSVEGYTYRVATMVYVANLQFKCNSYKKDIHKRYCKKHQNIAGDRKWMPTVILRPLSGVA